MIPHEKVSALRNLIRISKIRRIALASGCQIRFIKRPPVDNHIPGIVEIHLVTWPRNHPLDQDFVVKVKCCKLALMNAAGFHRDDNVSFLKRRRHRGPINPENRKEHCRNQRRGSCHRDDRKEDSEKNFPSLRGSPHRFVCSIVSRISCFFHTSAVCVIYMNVRFHPLPRYKKPTTFYSPLLLRQL